MLIATFAALPRPQGMRPLDFARALELADLDLLDFVADRSSFDRFAAVLETHPSVQRVHLLTGRHDEAPTAGDWVPMLRAFVADRGLSCEVLAEDAYAVDLDDEAQVLADAFTATRRLLAAPELRRDGQGGVLADFTGGERGMAVGATLACLTSDLPVRLLGSPYDAWGRALRQTVTSAELRLVRDDDG